MDHPIFVEKYRSNDLSVSVDRNKAGFLYGNTRLLPKKLRIRQALLRSIAFGGMVLGIILFFIVPWWLALGVLLFGFVMFPVAQKSAARGVLEASLQDPYVYETAIENEVLCIREPA